MKDIEEKVILILELISYMVEENVSLEKAYEDKVVPTEMRMTREEILETAQIFLKLSTKDM